MNIENIIYKLASASNAILLKEDGLQKLPVILEGMGFDKKRVLNIWKFVEDNISTEDFNKFVEVKAFVSYIDALTELEKYISIARGYQEMGEINSAITEEFNHLEEEGERNYEMVTDETEGDNQAG